MSSNAIERHRMSPNATERHRMSSNVTECFQMSPNAIENNKDRQKPRRINDFHVFDLWKSIAAKF